MMDGKLTAEQVRDAVLENFEETHETRYDHWEPSEFDWQAIADELNAELGGGNCARCAEDMGRYADSLCDPLKERIAELLRCLENDWHIHASWDGLRKFWCIELTEEGVWMRDAVCGTLTAEQVREAIFHGSVYASYDGAQYYANGINMQAIADELNATLGSGTCEYVIEDNMNETEGMGDVWFRCTNCGTSYDYYADEWLLRMPYCPRCGCEVER